MADMGGLVAKGDGTAAGKPNVAVEGPRLKPRLGRFAVVGGGLVADGVEGVGTVLLLNSAQRGHLRLVSILKEKKRIVPMASYNFEYEKYKLTHVSHLTTMTASSLFLKKRKGIVSLSRKEKDKPCVP